MVDSGSNRMKSGKDLEMHSVFKCSLILLGISFGIGQSWVHKAADASELASMRAVGRACPSLAVKVRSGQASRFDAVTLRDAYWRIRIGDAVSGFVGDRTDGCAVRA